ncbi:MAG: T9SS type A sorting domain-containing protein [Vicingaceae bacterium]
MNNKLALLFIGFVLSISLKAQIRLSQSYTGLPNQDSISFFYGNTEKVIPVDFDQDGDLDLIASGSCEGASKIFLYKNDGNGKFERDENVNLNQASNSKLVDALDLDGDQDLDLIILSNNVYRRLFNVNNNFQIGNRLNYLGQLIDGSFVAGDIDNDQDNDIIISGQLSGTNTFISRIFYNDGTGHFPYTNTTINGRANGKSKLIDRDLDGDLELLICGDASSIADNCYFYENDGNGNFSLNNKSYQIKNYSDCIIEVEDLDTNGYPDILIYGRRFNGLPKTDLYLNNGGDYYLADSTTFLDEPIKLIDYDNDQLSDILLLDSKTKLKNLNGGTFTNDGLLGESVKQNAVSSTALDANGDGFEDILQFGPGREYNLAKNDKNGNFYSQLDFRKIKGELKLLIDVDNDSKNDFLVINDSIQNYNTAHFFKNQENSLADEVPVSLNLINQFLDESEFVKINLNNDSLDDFLLIVRNSITSIIAYTNNGNQSFTSSSLQYSVNLFDFVLKDINQDGLLDLVCVGDHPTAQNGTAVYSALNLGNGSFSNFTADASVLISVFNSKLFVEDFDSDGDFDYMIFYGPFNPSFQGNFLILENNGNGNFNYHSNDPVQANARDQVYFADFTNDGHIDYLKMVHTNSNYTTSLYEGDGQMGFTLLDDSTFAYLKSAQFKVEDLDGDQDLDLIFSSNFGLEVYRSTSNGLQFIRDIQRTDLQFNKLNYDDLDQDGRKELILSSRNEANCTSDIRIYKNINCRDSSKIFVTACGEYNWNGSRYTSSIRTYRRFILPNKCDSIVELNLTILPTQSKIETIYECSGSYTWRNGITYTSNNSTDTVRFTNQFGCDSVFTLNLTLNALDTVVDKVNSCDPSYTWIDGNTYTNNTTSPTVILQNQHGCDSLVMLDLEFNALNDSIYILNNQIYARETNAQFQWLNCNNNLSRIPNATQASYEPADTGLFALEVRNANCIDTSDCILYQPTDLNELTLDDRFSIFPNPIRNQFTIKSSLTAPYDLFIYSYDGKLMLHQTNIQENSIEINPELANGLYLFQIRINKQTIEKRIAVIR